jgi:hypothetical protein
MPGAFANDFSQAAVQWMFPIRPIESVIAIAPADNQICAFQLGQLILHRAQRQEAQARQLTRIQLLSGVGEEQSQHFRPHNRKQSMQQRLFHVLTDTRLL